MRGATPEMIPVCKARRILQSKLKIPIGRATFYRWLKSGRLKAFVVGGHYWIRLETLEELSQEACAHKDILSQP